MLALKELLAGKLKFGLIALAVGLVVSLTMLMAAMSQGLVTGMTGAKQALEADVLVFQGGTQLELERSLLSAEDLATIREAGGVKDVYGVGHAMVSVETADTSFDSRVFGLAERWEQLPAVEGRGGRPQPGETIADVTAQNEGVALGDKVRLSPAGVELEVVGFTRDRRYVMAPAFYVDMATWEQIHLAVSLGRQPEAESGAAADSLAESFRGSASVAAVTLGGGTPEELAARLEPRFEAATPSEAALAGNGMPVMVLAVDAIQIFSLVLGALVIGIFFYVTTLHKSAQLAAVKALGASNGYLYRQLLAQILLLVTVAAAFGTILALGAGASMPPTMAFDLGPDRWALTLVAVYGMALVGSLFSLRGILTIDPATALDRGEH
jgi:putative ABC transport system permease protein